MRSPKKKGPYEGPMVSMLKRGRDQIPGTSKAGYRKPNPIPR